MAIDRTVQLSVTGMTCHHCVMSVTEELQEVPGVKNVSVMLEPEGTSTVTVITDTGVEDDAMREAISEAGYDLVGIARDF